MTLLRGLLASATLCVFLAHAAGAHGPGGKSLDIQHRTAENAVGPIYYGEDLAEVWKTLGKTTPSRRCRLIANCRAAKYTDGDNLLVLEYLEDAIGVYWIQIFAHARSAEATRLPSSVPPLTEWRWRGVRVLALPAPRLVTGWTTERSGGYTSFHYGHGCATAFEQAPGRPRFTFYCE